MMKVKETTKMYLSYFQLFSSCKVRQIPTKHRAEQLQIKDLPQGTTVVLCQY